MDTNDITFTYFYYINTSRKISVCVARGGERGTASVQLWGGGTPTVVSVRKGRGTVSICDTRWAVLFSLM